MMIAKRDLRGFLEQMLVRFYTGLPEAFWPVGRGVLRRKERGILRMITIMMIFKLTL